MAGRYVLLEFDDRDSAESFVTNPSMPDQLGYEIKAMYVSPRQFCECPDKRRQQAKNWSKGKRTGLYLCMVCRKPSVHHQTGVLKRLQYVFGFNLLGDKEDD